MNRCEALQYQINSKSGLSVQDLSAATTEEICLKFLIVELNVQKQHKSHEGHHSGRLRINFEHARFLNVR